MKTQKQIEEKMLELNKRMSELGVMDVFGVASTDGQRYILEWVLDQHDD